MIRKQITAAFLLVSLLSVLISGLISFFSLTHVRSITESSILDTASRNLQLLADETGVTVDRRLKKYADELHIIANYVADIYNHPGNYKPVFVPHAQDVQTGGLTLHYYMDADAEEDPDKIALLGNAQRIFAPMKSIFPEISSIYLADVSGANLDYDAAASTKSAMVENGFVAAERDWYKNAVLANALVISDVYSDAGGRGETITFSVPIYTNAGFQGVLGLNIPFAAMNEIASFVAVGNGGATGLIADGEIPPEEPGILSATSQLTLVDWTVQYSVPEKTVMEPVDEVDSRIYRSIVQFAVLLGLVVGITTLAASAFAKRISVPLTATAVEKERISAELGVAKKIQVSMLPHIFPPFPHRREIDLFGIMEPAREVGGDFYDFFFLDENRLAVVIADVSDKGVPASLFMVTAKTLLKNYAQMKKPLSEVFETVNNILLDNNEQRMFVTCFMGCLDLQTGTFTSVNAGHNPPLLLSGGKWAYYKTKRSLILAGRNNTKYEESTVTLQPGDAVFFYTDGVTEAFDVQRNLYGSDRLVEVANKNHALSPHDFCAALRADVAAFAHGAVQADDITMLMVKYMGE